jgi:hypothetical protein
MGIGSRRLALEPREPGSCYLECLWDRLLLAGDNSSHAVVLAVKKADAQEVRRAEHQLEVVKAR